jgi:ABC-type branched-subunit amino acid transport system ATPase component
MTRSVDLLNTCQCWRHQLVLKVADRGYVLHLGQIIHQGGTKDELKNSEIVKKAYLGG